VSKPKIFKLVLSLSIFEAFDSVHMSKIEKILIAYGIPAETVSAIMMLYENTRSLV